LRRVIFPAGWLIAVMVSLLLTTAQAQTGDQAEGDKNKTASAVLSSLPIKLSGYAQIQGAWENEANDTFSIRRARLTLSGQLLKSLRLKVQLDFTKSPALLDAQAEVVPRREISFRAGQFLVPFSLENITSSSDLLTINRSQAVEKLVPGRDNGSSGRDIGAAFFGSYSIFDYTLSILNGSGANKADSNDHKDLAVRLVTHPLKTLSLGISIYNGRQTASDSPALLLRNRYGLELAFNYQRFGLQAEFIQAKDDMIKKEGWYALATYSVIRQKLQLVTRLEAINLDRNLPDQKTTIYTAGANWFLTSRSKFQANYEYHQTESGPDHQAVFFLLQAGF